MRLVFYLKYAIFYLVTLGMYSFMWDDFQKTLSPFGIEVTRYLKKLGIFDVVQFLVADHLGIRLKNSNDVLVLKQELLQEGRCISSAVVNGREIYIFALNQALQVGSWTIPCVELPHPKPEHPYTDGWEHVEFVIPSSAMSLVELRVDFKEISPTLDIELLKRKNEYFESEPSAEADQLRNPTIELRRRVGLAVKFHPWSIQEVVGAS